MKHDLFNVLLVNEALRDATKKDILELQTYLIDHVEGSEDIDFELRENHAYGFAIHLTHKGHECDVVWISRAAKVGSDHGYGIKVQGKPLKMSFTLDALVEDVHIWLNGWISDW